MFSAGMFTALAASMTVPTRGGVSGAPPPPPPPPPARPAPAHRTRAVPQGLRSGSAAPREDEPDVGARVPGPALIIAQNRLDPKAGALDPADHLRHRQGAKDERKGVRAARSPAPLDVLLVEDR